LITFPEDSFVEVRKSNGISPGLLSPLTLPSLRLRRKRRKVRERNFLLGQLAWNPYLRVSAKICVPINIIKKEVMGTPVKPREHRTGDRGSDHL